MGQAPSQARQPSEFAQARHLPPRWGAKVVGVSFAPGYPDTMVALNEAAERAYLFGPVDDDEFGRVYGRGERAEVPTPEPLAAILIHTPDNPVDPNAVEVHVPALGTDVAMIGHLPRHLAARLAPCLDRGEVWQAEVTEVLVHPDHPTNPGISLTVHRVEAST